MMKYLQIAFNRRCFSSAQAAFQKKKIVIVGSGWSGYRMATDLDYTKYDIELVSPRNYFLFTPLLPSTAAKIVTLLPKRKFDVRSMELFQLNHVNLEV